MKWQMISYPGHVSNTLLPEADRAVARVVARESGHSERREHSGMRVLLSVQVARPERRAGLLVMRRSGVRLPKAAPKAAPTRKPSSYRVSEPITDSPSSYRATRAAQTPPLPRQPGGPLLFVG